MSICAIIACSASIVGGALDYGTTYSNGLAETATDYIGNVHDVSRFHQDEQINFNIGGHIILDSNTRINVGYDNGIDTPKYDRKKSYTLGVTQVFDLGDQQYLSVGGTYTYGGQVRETPCHDADGVRYHCGTAGLWSLHKTEEHKVPVSVSIRYTYFF